MIFVTNDDGMGKNIRYLRQKIGISRQQLAQRMGICFRELCDIEEGTQWEIDGAVLINICQFFHIPPETLVEKKMEKFL